MTGVAVDDADLQQCAVLRRAGEHREALVDVLSADWVPQGVQHVFVADPVLASASCDDGRHTKKNGSCWPSFLTPIRAIDNGCPSWYPACACSVAGAWSAGRRPGLSTA